MGALGPRAREGRRRRPCARVRGGALAVSLALAGCDGTRGTVLYLGEIDAQGSSSPALQDAGDASRDAAPGATPVWHPSPGTTWQIQLNGTIDTSVDAQMYEVDLFTETSVLADLKSRGRVVVGFLSAGSWEPGRDDADAFPPEALGNSLPGYPSERWLDVGNPTVRTLMAARLDVARAHGFDGIDLSNVDGYEQDTGLGLTMATELDYVQWLSAEARARGLSVGIAANPGLIGSVSAAMDWGLAEECLASDECEAWQPVLAAGKTVFMVEFGTDADAPTLCAEAARMGLDLVIKRRALDAFRITCPSTAAGG